MPPPNYKKFTRKTLKRIGSTTARGGTRNAWRKLGETLRQKHHNTRVASASRLKANAKNWSPENHVLRLRKKAVNANSNANFTRKENKKMANELFKELHRQHVKRQS
jgi:hypothetical protein